MSDVQIAVGLGREAGVNGGVFACFKIVFNQRADKVVIGKLVFG